MSRCHHCGRTPSSSSSGGSCERLSVTRAEALAMADAGGVNICFEYYIVDRDVVLKGADTDKFSLAGYVVSRNPVYAPSGIYMGQWNSGLSTPDVGDIVAWNKFHYESLTGAVGTAPDADTINWSPLGDEAITMAGFTTRTDSSYIAVMYDCGYDIVDDLMLWVFDDLGNRIYGHQGFLKFQWGNANVAGNSCGASSYVNTLNNNGLVNKVTVGSGKYLDASTNQGVIESSSFNANCVCNMNDGFSITDLVVDSPETFTFDPDISITSGLINESFSDIAKNYVLNTTTFTFNSTYDKQTGRAYISSSSSSLTINLFANFPLNHPVRFYPAAALTALTFTHNTGANQPVCDLGISPVLNGANRDWVEFTRRETFKDSGIYRLYQTDGFTG